ncbi:MAG: hypothetical protein WC058_00660 [Phycisphaeraceae bacterium]
MNWQDAMTSKKVRLSGIAWLWPAVTVVVFALSGCEWLTKERIQQPGTLTSPYPGPKLWAVVPLRNETGTSIADGAVMADKIGQQIAQVRGMIVLPTNRVMDAMAALKLREVRSVTDAMALIQTLDCDGLIVGSMTGWDPYEPPKIGVTLQLYSRRNPSSDAGSLDSREMTYAGTDSRLPQGTTRYSQPVAQAAGYFDAANHEVIAALQRYSVGRVPLESPAGWRSYLINMDLYAEFVSFELTKNLLLAETARIAPPPGGSDSSAPARQNNP